MIANVGDTLEVEQMLTKSKNTIDSDPSVSLNHALKALNLAKTIHYARGEAEALRRVGIYYLNHSEYPKALDYVLKSLRISEKIDDKKLISKCLMNLGLIYSDYGENNLALSYFSKALKIARSINDKESISAILTNTANVHTDMGNFKSALENYQNALKINVELQDKHGISISLSNIGNVYFYQKNYKATEDYYLKCLKLKKEINDIQGVIIILNNLGNLYLNLNNLNKALEFCKQSMDMAAEIDDKDDIHRASYNLANIYKRKGDYKTALAYYELGSMLKDSIFNEVKNKELGKLESKYELEKQEAQIKLLKKDKALKEEQSQRQISNRNLIIGAILLFSVIIVSLIQNSNNRKIKKINQQLLSINKEIAAKSAALAVANEELDNFIYRSSHDLKAPLTSVLGLINITQLQVEANDKLKDYLERMQESVDRLMIVLQDLTNYSKNSRLEIKSEVIDFDTVVKDSIDELTYLPHHGKVQYKVNVSGSGVFKSDPARIEILLNNILSNAIIHNNYENTQPPFVEIAVNYTSQLATIKVSDSGIGIPEAILPRIYDMFFKGNNESLGAGLGLYIVQGVVKKLEGEINVETRELQGTTFTIIIPANI